MSWLDRKRPAKTFSHHDRRALPQNFSGPSAYAKAVFWEQTQRIVKMHMMAPPMLASIPLLDEAVRRWPDGFTLENGFGYFGSGKAKP